MKNWLFAALLFTPIMLWGIMTPDDVWLAAGFLLVGSALLVGMTYFRKSLQPLTRYARRHPRSIQVIMTVVQLILIPLAIWNGYNLQQLGFEFGDTGYYIFAGLLGLSLACIPFFRASRTFTLPKTYRRTQIGLLGISLAAFGALTLFGNQLESSLPASPLTQVVKQADSWLLSDPVTEAQLMAPLAATAITSGTQGQGIQVGSRKPEESNQKQIRRQLKRQKHIQKRLKRRMRAASAGAVCTLAVLFFILLLGSTCAGICMIVLSGTALGILGGVAVLALSAWGMISVINWCNRARKRSRNNPDSPS